MKILFMCVANSARSQLAEGLARSLFGSDVEVQSAGSKPSHVNPFAVQVLQEVGIDISTQFSKSIADLAPGFVADLDYIITLCAEEVCPVLLTPKAKKLHWPIPDPAGHSERGAEAQRILFQDTRDDIQGKLEHFKQELNL